MQAISTLPASSSASISCRPPAAGLVAWRGARCPRQRRGVAHIAEPDQCAYPKRDKLAAVLVIPRRVGDADQ
jgi:hypothetical protein